MGRVFINTRTFGRSIFIVVPPLIGYGFGISGGVGFVFWTVMLLAYLGYEMLMERVEGKRKIFSDPCVISTVATFGITFGVSNIGCLGAENFVFADGSFQDLDYVWLNRAMTLIFVSAVMMWVGYDSPVGRLAANRFWKNRFFENFLRKTYRLRWPVIGLCLVASVASRYVQASLGVFGYSSEIDQLYAVAAYRQYLDIGVSLGRVALVGLSLAYFSGEDRSPSVKYALLLFLVLEVGFGFLSGFKGQTITPILIVMICQYIITGKFSKRGIIATALILYASYLIIEPFRFLRYSDEGFRGRDIATIGSAMWEIAEDPDRFGFNRETSRLEEFINRTGLTVEAARTIRFKEEIGIPEGAPQFLRNILISPVYAFVPRLVWESKPFGNLGQWYGQAIHRETTEVNSIGMSPVGYLYLTGGVIGVVVGFYAVGFLLRIFSGSLVAVGSGGMFVFIGMMSMFMFVDSSVDIMFASWFRFLPLLVLSQRYLFVS